MTKKISPQDALKSSDTKLRNAAIVYLREERDYPAELISKATRLAISTIKSYVSKFKHLLDWAKEIFTKAKNHVRKSSEVFWVYIDKITLPSGEIWCKIGQTTQTPEKRGKGFKWTINGEKVKPAKVEVQTAIKCKNATCMQNMEDCLRLGMTAIDQDKYAPNDRLLCWEDNYPQRIMENQFVQMGLAQFAAWFKNHAILKKPLDSGFFVW